MPTKRIHRTSSIQIAGMSYWYDHNAPGSKPKDMPEASEQHQKVIEQIVQIDEGSPASDVLQAGSAWAMKRLFNWRGSELGLLAAGSAIEPLTPPPEEVGIYSDIMPAVVDEAKEMGYNAHVLNLMRERDFQVLQDNNIKHVIMTGVAYQLTDDQITDMIYDLRNVGVEHAALNFSNKRYPDSIIEIVRKQGVYVHLRDPNDITLLGERARVQETRFVAPLHIMGNFPQPEIASQLSGAIEIQHFVVYNL